MWILFKLKNYISQTCFILYTYYIKICKTKISRKIMDSTHNIFDILKLLSKCYYNNSSILLMNNQNHLENRFLVVLKETFSSDYEPQWYNQIKQVIISSENETCSRENAPHDNNVNLQIFLDLFKNLCRVLGDKIKLCSHSSSLHHSNTNKHGGSIIDSDQNIEIQCPFSLILKIFKFVIDCQLDILFSSLSSFDLHKLIATIDQFVCKELFGQDILLEHQQHQQQQPDKNCTIWWITWLYERSPWNDNLHPNENLHSLHHLIDITDLVINILRRYIPKLNKEAEISLISKDDGQQREIRKKHYIILSELFVKMIQIIVRSLDEVLIPIIMVLKIGLSC
ncbi:hypothetical protein C1645_336732 [Glomus cerebriforme]|uniref:Uncharacterized protein n=1 Tax=Glomus cerebriforme TaxID=658196 RepID=A0A397TPF7_9GLOM|nr:hypothetical protein C1645_336732 [Glomus cerebriforme]